MGQNRQPDRRRGPAAKAPNWLKVSGETAGGQTVEGWVERAPIFLKDAKISATGRVQSGEGSKEWTLDYVKRMLNDGKFAQALRTTLLLIVLILPVQFTLAIIMALVLQSQLKFNSFFLYLYAIPLGISDLAAGLVWYTIFTQSGYLNSLLQSLGIIDKPYIFISSANKEWIIVAIVLAEIWRATSLVMVIVVSGLQAIPRDYLEAGEIFGASLWQRLRHIILPLLKPSLQVALILRTILAFQVFAVVVAISGGDVVTTLANETYRWYDISSYNNKNVAAAYSGFIMLLSLGIAVFYLRAVRTQKKRRPPDDQHDDPPGRTYRQARARARSAGRATARDPRAPTARAGTYAIALAIAVWIMLPIWLVGTLAFTRR